MNNEQNDNVNEEAQDQNTEETNIENSNAESSEANNENVDNSEISQNDASTEVTNNDTTQLAVGGADETQQEEEKSQEEQDIEYVKQKEILFIKDDMKKLDKDKTDYSKIMKYYKRKLVDYDAIRTIKNQCKSEGKYIKVKEVA